MNGRTGRRIEATQVLNQLLELSSRGYSLPQQIALVYSGLGDNDSALEWLEKAYQERSDGILSVKMDPMWDPLRPDLRFAALLKKLGLEK